MKLPAHPEADDPPPDPHPGDAMSWGARVFLAVVIALFVAIVVLHLTGVVGPAAH